MCVQRLRGLAITLLAAAVLSLGCGATPTEPWAEETPVAARFYGYGTARVYARATVDTSEGEILVVAGALSPRLHVQFEDPRGGPTSVYPAVVRLVVETADGTLAYWRPDANGNLPFVGQVVGVNAGTTSMTIQLLRHSDGAQVIRFAPVVVAIEGTE